jgi:nucleoside-diphosphate-sugar epimerase
MKVMILGGYGNLGQELCRMAGHDVLPVGRREWRSLTPGMLAGVDVVIHAASDLRSDIAENPAAVLESEVMVTAWLLDLMRDCRIPRLMYVSSCAVYGAEETTETNTSISPVTINGQLKLLNERVIEGFCRRHGVTREIYRVFNTFGGADHFSVVSRIIDAAKQGKLLTVHNGGQGIRDFIHAADVAAILTGFLDRPPPYSCVNIGTGRPTRIGDLVGIAQRECPGLQVRHVSGKEGIARSVADTTRLLSCIGKYEFHSVADFLQTTLQAAAVDIPHEMTARNQA